MLTSKPAKVGKVVICGMKGIGKTAILEQLIYGNITPDSVCISFELMMLFSIKYCIVYLRVCVCAFFQEIHPTIEDTYVASVDTGRGVRDILRIYDTAGLQGTVQVSRGGSNIQIQ